MGTNQKKKQEGTALSGLQNQEDHPQSNRINASNPQGPPKRNYNKEDIRKKREERWKTRIGEGKAGMRIIHDFFRRCRAGEGEERKKP